MARPAGRYFASVIAKIRDAKKKEQIVVDDGFKLRLRQQIMAKIAVQVQPARTSWMERLAPFKSYFAVVPALALVIVAVVGLSKLPIVFKSNTVVPVSNPSQQNNPVQPAVQSTSNIEQTAVTNPDTVTNGGIKTFPGRYVLPSNYFSNAAGNTSPSFDPQFLQTNVEAPQPVSTGPQQVNSQPSTSANNTAPEQKTVVSDQTSTPIEQAPVQYFSFLPLNNTAHVGEGNVQPAPQSAPQEIAPAPVPTALPSVSGSTPSAQINDTSASSVSGSTPFVSAEQDQTASNETTASVSVVDTSTPAIAPEAVQNVPPAAEVMAPAVVEMKPKSPTALATQPANEVQLNDIAALPAQQMDANVFYSGNFSSDERTILEQNVVPYLADGKSVESVNVYQKDAATIAIELTYSNGKIAIYHYKVDENGTWKLVQYTTGTVKK